jgi:hypothetical protein
MRPRIEGTSSGVAALNMLGYSTLGIILFAERLVLVATKNVFAAGKNYVRHSS